MVARILVGTDIGFLLGAAATYEFYTTPLLGLTIDDLDNTGSTALAIAGAGLLAASMILFVSARDNRKQVAPLLINQERALLPDHFTGNAKSFSAAPCIIPLNSR